MKIEYHTTEETCSRRFHLLPTGRVTGILMAINIVLFVLLSLPAAWGLVNGDWLVRTFGQVNADIWDRYRYWQLVTALFLHGSVGHLLGNMIPLWFFGSWIESEKGSRYFTQLYFSSGIGACVLQMAIDPASTIPGIGASGAIFGLIVAYGILFRGRQVLVFGVFPMKAETVAAVFLAIEIYMCLTMVRDGVGHWVHMSGAVIGALFVWLMRRLIRRQAEKNQPGSGSGKRFSNIEF